MSCITSGFLRYLRGFYFVFTNFVREILYNLVMVSNDKAANTVIVTNRKLA